MRKWIYILCLPLFLMACNQQAVEQISEGYLRVGKIEIMADQEVTPLQTRGVHESLQVDIYQGAVRVYSYAPGELVSDAPIALPVGQYTLVAHSVDMTEPGDGSCGVPLYSVSRDFEIQVDQTTTVDGLIALRVNAGVSVTYQDELFEQTMSEIQCVVQSPSGRTVTISGTKDNSIYYFSLPENGKFTYYIKCKNIDGEDFQTEPKETVVDQPKNYVIKVTL